MFICYDITFTRHKKMISIVFFPGHIGPVSSLIDSQLNHKSSLKDAVPLLPCIQLHFAVECYIAILLHCFVSRAHHGLCAIHRVPVSLMCHCIECSVVQEHINKPWTPIAVTLSGCDRWVELEQSPADTLSVTFLRQSQSVNPGWFFALGLPLNSSKYREVNLG